MSDCSPVQGNVSWVNQPSLHYYYTCYVINGTRYSYQCTYSYKQLRSRKRVTTYMQYNQYTYSSTVKHSTCHSLTTNAHTLHLYNRYTVCRVLWLHCDSRLHTGSHSTYRRTKRMLVHTSKQTYLCNNTQPTAERCILKTYTVVHTCHHL